jgi:hypothetical protein
METRGVPLSVSPARTAVEDVESWGALLSARWDGNSPVTVALWAAAGAAAREGGAPPGATPPPRVCLGTAVVSPAALFPGVPSRRDVLLYTRVTVTLPAPTTGAPAAALAPAPAPAPAPALPRAASDAESVLFDTDDEEGAPADASPPQAASPPASPAAGRSAGARAHRPPTPATCAALLLKETSAVGRSWRPRWVELRGGLLSFFSAAPEEGGGGGADAGSGAAAGSPRAPLDALRLLPGTTVRPLTRPHRNPAVKYELLLEVPGAPEVNLSAGTEALRAEWMAALAEAAAEALRGSPAREAGEEEEEGEVQEERAPPQSQPTPTASTSATNQALGPVTYSVEVPTGLVTMELYYWPKKRASKPAVPPPPPPSSSEG